MIKKKSGTEFIMNSVPLLFIIEKLQSFKPSNIVLRNLIHFLSESSRS